MRKLLTVAAVLVFIAGVLPRIHATTIDPATGSQGFDTPTLVSADASPTGNINTASTFTLANLQTTANSTGAFAGIPTQDFGTVALTPSSATGFNFANSVFGAFKSDSISVTDNTPGFLDILIDGSFTPGTFESNMRPGMAVFRASLTQTPASSGEISFSGTMSISTIPEPSTLLLFGSGLGLLAALLWFSNKHSWTGPTI